jgi:hypothetical protein
MKHNLYRFTVEQLEDSNGKAVEVSPLVFETSSHEDIFKIAQIMQRKVDLAETDATAFAIGLKLFSGVMIKNKDQELIKELMPNLTDMMKTLKNN